MYQVLVCGGRDFTNREWLETVLNGFHKNHGIARLINGGAKGADILAYTWAQHNGIETKTFPITRDDWKRHGLAAGPLRNQRMLDEAFPDCVIAFPGGNGTADMVERARAQGVPFIIELQNPPTEKAKTHVQA
jgi:hypothetical protein